MISARNPGQDRSNNRAPQGLAEDAVQMPLTAGVQPVVLAVTGQDADDAHLEVLFTEQREAEWAEFLSDCAKYETELAGEVAKGKLTLSELEEEEQSLERLRRWYRAIRGKDLFGASSALLAEQRLKECAEALDRFAEQVYRAREHGGPG
jgi:hypothetical protein